MRGVGVNKHTKRVVFADTREHRPFYGYCRHYTWSLTGQFLLFIKISLIFSFNYMQAQVSAYLFANTCVRLYLCVFVL